MAGGKCGPGFMSASFAKSALPVTGPLSRSDPIAGLIVSSVVGGTGSVLGGGKFTNGAETAAFGYLLNQMQSLRHGEGTSLFNSPVHVLWDMFFHDDDALAPSNTLTWGVGGTYSLGVGATAGAGVYWNPGNGGSELDYGLYGYFGKGYGFDASIGGNIGYTVGGSSNLAGLSTVFSPGISFGDIGGGVSISMSDGKYSGFTYNYGLKWIPIPPLPAGATFTVMKPRTCILSARQYQIHC
jgi:hypothetical protein